MRRSGGRSTPVVYSPLFQGNFMSYPKLMIHKGKHDDRLILLLTPDDEGPAWLAMFNAMDQGDQLYSDLDEDENKAYVMARTAPRLPSRWGAAKWLLQHRGGFGIEYENVYIVAIYTPATLGAHFDG